MAERRAYEDASGYENYTECRYDGLKKPQTGNSAVYPTDNAAFCEGVEQFAGERHIIVNLTLDPNKHAHHRVPMALR